MIAEISAIVAGVNAATSAIKRVAETTNDISSISSFLSTLGGAEVELARAQNEGKLSEGDAVKAALAKKADTRHYEGDQGSLYNQWQCSTISMKLCLAMAEARKAKQAET